MADRVKFMKNGLTSSVVCLCVCSGLKSLGHITEKLFKDHFFFISFQIFPLK